MRRLTTLLAGLLLVCDAVSAADAARTTALRPTVTSRGQTSDNVTATSVGHGQAGYVHYFQLTFPDGSLEYQIGIELEDQRIAWSVPNVGVMVSTFIKEGILDANGTEFKIKHLHGIKPFRRDAEMRRLQKELTQRVAQWIDDQTPYCLQRTPGQPFCLSCGDFVVRILYPGASPITPALPRDFVRITGPTYTTNDLLLYMAGLHDQPDKQSMLAKLATMDVPAVMREDIVSMIGLDETSVTSTITARQPDRTPLSSSVPIAKEPATKLPPASRVATRRQLARKF
jgi:hypothetical protein